VGEAERFKKCVEEEYDGMALPKPRNLVRGIVPFNGEEWSTKHRGEFVARSLWHLVESVCREGGSALSTAETLIDSVNLIAGSVVGLSGAGGGDAAMHALLVRAGLTVEQCKEYVSAFTKDGIGVRDLKTMVSTDEGGAEVKEDFGVTPCALHLIKVALGKEQEEGKDNKCSEGGGGDQTGHLATLSDELVRALSWACQNGHRDVAELLLDRGAGVETTKPTLRPLATKHTKEETMTFNKEYKRLRKEGLPTKDAMDETTELLRVLVQLKLALMLACENGHRDVAELLLDRGADVGQARQDGGTALMSACQNGNGDVVELLLDRGADVGQAKQNGVTALLIACRKGHRGVAELLLDRGADVGQADEVGGTALTYACRKGHRGVAELLLDRDADVRQARQDGGTALMWACQGGHRDMVEIEVPTWVKQGKMDGRP
jgi:ankyrin repeat protein